MIWLIPLTILSAILYRLGGWGDEGRKQFPNAPDWLFNTKARDIGCALCACLAVRLLCGSDIVWYLYIPCFGLLFGSLTTYWDFINGKDNFWLHGFACGIAFMPFAFHITWWALLLRAVVLAVGMGLVSVLSGKDIVEECGRGALIIATLPLILIGG